MRGANLRLNLRDAGLRLPRFRVRVFRLRGLPLVFFPCHCPGFQERRFPAYLITPVFLIRLRRRKLGVRVRRHALRRFYVGLRSVAFPLRRREIGARRLQCAALHAEFRVSLVDLRPRLLVIASGNRRSLRGHIQRGPLPRDLRRRLACVKSR